jgi:hypothetical protein
MRLFSLQTPDVWNTLKTEGVYRALKSKAEYLKDPDDFQIFGKAYEYITDIMLLKGIDKPLRYDFVKNTPIWAWFLHNGKHFVDLRTETRVNKPGSVCIELEIPDEQVLLSGYEIWHMPLNNGYISDDFWNDLENDCENDVIHSQEEIENSWIKCFDPEFLKHESFIQATFFEMKLNWVKNVRFFGSKKTKK